MRKIAFSYPLLLLAIWTGVLLAGNYVVVETSFHQLLANDYATTTGEIMRSDLHQVSGYVKRGVNMSYSYSVNGMDYTGHRYRYDDRNGAFDYRSVTNAFRTGSHQTIYYDPANPADCVLAPGLRGCDLLLIVFALPLDVMTAAIWYGVGRSKAPGGPNRIGRARIIEGKDETRVRLVDVSPLAAGFFGAGATAFAAAMVVVLVAGFAPSLTLMYGVLATVGIAGALTFLWMLQRCQRGLYDLRIRHDADSIVVPAKAGRTSPLTIPRLEIACVSLEKNVTQNPSGQYISFTTVIWRSVPGAGVVAVPLVDWGWPEVQARALAMWLSDELAVPFQEEKKAAKAAVAAAR